MIAKAKDALESDLTQWMAFDDVKNFDFGISLPTQTIDTDGLKALVKEDKGSVGAWLGVFKAAFENDPQVVEFFRGAAQRLEP